MNRPSRPQRRPTRLPVGLEALEGRIAPAGLISLGDASVAEGDNGQTTFLNFQVTRSGDLNPQVSVSYHTEDGSAHSGVDFAAQAGNVVFAPGAANATISVPIIGNQILQPNRNFRVVLDDVVGVTVPFTLGAPASFAAGPAPAAVASGDFNGDGKLDLVVANSGDNTLSLLRNITPPGAPTPSFAPAQPVTAGRSPTALAVGDLNGDGKLDLAVTNAGSSVVLVLLNRTPPGFNGFQFAEPLKFATGAGAASVAIADMNGDGKPDLAVADGAANTVSVLFNTTAPGFLRPSFAPRQAFPAGPKPVSVTTADVNGDGKADLVIADGDSAAPGVSLLLNTTAPGAAVPAFGPLTTFPASGRPTAVAAGDLNGDGRPDLVVSSDVGNTASILFNATPPGAASPNFLPRQTLAGAPNSAAVALGDLNGDGRSDLAFAGDGLGSSVVSVVLNQTTPGLTSGQFDPPKAFAVGVAPVGVALNDFNGDGTTDLAIADRGSGGGGSPGAVFVLPNTTRLGLTPDFSVQQSFTTGGFPAAVAAGDLNGDGKPDLVVANNSTNSLSVFLNTTAPGAASTTFVRTTVATSRGPKSVAITDINGDGKPDVVATSYATSPYSPVAGADGVTVLLNTTAPGSTAASFTAPTNFTTSPAVVNPRFVAAGDLNGDGKPDLAVVGRNSSRVAVLLNTTAPGAAAPTFSAPAAFTVGSSNRSVAIGDLNGDGKADLVVPNYNNNTVSVLLNTTAAGAAAPTFAGKVDFAVGSAPYSVAIGDLNGDGKPDLAVANYRSDFLSFLLNTTSPGAAAPSFAPQQQVVVGRNGPLSIVIADFDRDGKPDIATANYFKNNALVLGNTTTPGSPTLSFGAPVFPVAGSAPYSVAAADLNGDGKPDLAVANARSNIVSVILNATVPSATISGTSGPTFGAGQAFTSGGSTTFFVTVGDLNGDGRPDVVVANNNSQSVSVLINTTPAGSTTSNFAPPQSFTVGDTPGFVAIGDLNGDGKPDLAVANLGPYPDFTGSVSILLNTTPLGEAQASFAPQFNVPTGTQSNSVAIADLNGDGKPDLAVANSGSFLDNSASGVTVLLNTTAPGDPTPSFGPPVSLPSGYTTRSIQAADIDGDGRPDLIVTVRYDLVVSVFLNRTPAGSATPVFSGPTLIPTNSYAYSLAIADLNGDGKPDLATANHYDGNVTILFNTTEPGDDDASFTPPLQVVIGTDSDSVTIGDLNGDGKPDIAVTGYASQAVTVLLNGTTPGSLTPNFTPQTPVAVGSSPFSMALGDINGDGRLDLIAANTFVDRFSVLLNTTVANASNDPSIATGTIVDDDAPASITAAAGDGQSTVIGTAFPTRLAVVVRNARGNPVQGAGVTFFVPAAGPSGLFGGSQPSILVLTEADGRATAPSLIANSVVGSYLATAQVGGLTQAAAFHLNNLAPGRAGRLAANVGGGPETRQIPAGRTSPPASNNDGQIGLAPSVMNVGGVGTLASGTTPVVTPGPLKILVSQQPPLPRVLPGDGSIGQGSTSPSSTNRYGLGVLNSRVARKFQARTKA